MDKQAQMDEQTATAWYLTHTHTNISTYSDTHKAKMFILIYTKTQSCKEECDIIWLQNSMYKSILLITWFIGISKSNNKI